MQSSHRVFLLPPSILAALLAASSLVPAGPVRAAGLELSAAAGADRGGVECVSAFACDRSGGFAKAAVGWRFDNGIDLQLHLFDAGRFKGGDTTALGTDFGGTFRVTAVGATAGWRWSVAPRWDVDLRAGLASVRTRFDYAEPAWGSRSKTTTQPLLGAGIAYALTPQWRVGLEFDATRIRAHREHGALQMLGASIAYAF